MRDYVIVSASTAADLERAVDEHVFYGGFRWEPLGGPIYVPKAMRLGAPAEWNQAMIKVWVE
jgi:hypothetical protein